MWRYCRGLFCLLSILAAAEISAQPLRHEGGQAATVARQICFPGRPQFECSSFLVADFAMLVRVVNSRSADPIISYRGEAFRGDDFGFVGAVQGEIGLMFNVTSRSAFGLTAAAVMEEFRNRAGGKFRFRFWEDSQLSFDVAAGMFVPVSESDYLAALDRHQWLVGTFALSQRDSWQFIFQLESHLQDYPEDRRTSAFYSGVQFREWPGALPALAGLVSIIITGAKAL